MAQTKNLMAEVFSIAHFQAQRKIGPVVIKAHLISKLGSKIALIKQHSTVYAGFTVLTYKNSIHTLQINKALKTSTVLPLLHKAVAYLS